MINLQDLDDAISGSMQRSGLAGAVYVLAVCSHGNIVHIASNAQKSEHVHSILSGAIEVITTSGADITNFEPKGNA